MEMFDIMGPTAKNENQSMFPSLSYRERLIGFAFCFFMGINSSKYRLFYSNTLFRFISGHFGRKSN